MVISGLYGSSARPREVVIILYSPFDVVLNSRKENCKLLLCSSMGACKSLAGKTMWGSNGSSVHSCWHLRDVQGRERLLVRSGLVIVSCLGVKRP